MKPLCAVLLLSAAFRAPAGSARRSERAGYPLLPRHAGTASYHALPSFAAASGAWTFSLQYLELAKPIFENIFGHSALSGFKVELIHICLVAILIVMLSMWRSNSISNALIKARLEEKESAKA